MDIGTLLWITWIAVGALIEIYAILTNKYDTLSEKIWKVSKKHWVLRIAILLTTIWATIHLTGECALGIC